MANFFTDNPALQFHLSHPLMQKIVALKENNFKDRDIVDFAPKDYEDAMDSYAQVLDTLGEICGDIIAPNAEAVDHQGPTLENGRVKYATGTQENLDAIRLAGLMGRRCPVNSAA